MDEKSTAVGSEDWVSETERSGHDDVVVARELDEMPMEVGSRPHSGPAVTSVRRHAGNTVAPRAQFTPPPTRLRGARDQGQRAAPWQHGL